MKPLFQAEAPKSDGYITIGASPMTCGAKLSEDRRYRYVLWRVWDLSLPHTVFIGLNPSTADETEDDNTIRRCIGFARSWGCGGLYMLNLFAWRETDPSKLKKVTAPIGSENSRYLLQYTKYAKFVIAAWGSNGAFLAQGAHVRRLLEKKGIMLHCLARNKDGSPAHPLYLPKTSKPIPL